MKASGRESSADDLCHMEELTAPAATMLEAPSLEAPSLEALSLEALSPLVSAASAASAAGLALALALGLPLLLGPLLSSAAAAWLVMVLARCFGRFNRGRPSAVVPASDMAVAGLRGSRYARPRTSYTPSNSRRSIRRSAIDGRNGSRSTALRASAIKHGSIRDHCPTPSPTYCYTLPKLSTLAPFLTLGQPAAPHARRPRLTDLPPRAAFLARSEPACTCSASRSRFSASRSLAT